MRGRRARGIETVVIREVAFGHRECGYGSVYELLLVGTAWGGFMGTIICEIHW
jgi:hypothetical protein